MRILSILTFLIIYSCTQTPDKVNKTALNETDTIVKEESKAVHSDTFSDKQKANKDTANNKTTQQQKKPIISYSRFEEVPDDDNFNGKPMILQMNFASTLMQLYPDTLIHLAKERYSGYDRFFPVSIQDDFEKGISTERIHYPKLIFEFQLFETEYASKPYSVKHITIKKERNGTLTTE